MTEELESVGILDQLKSRFIFIMGFVGILWVIEIINTIFNHHLSEFGVLPRHISGLPGIIFSPFLHGSIGHLMLNSMPLILLGGLVMFRGIWKFVRISLIITILSGLGVWIFGRLAYHVGASGLIFGFFGFLLASAWFEKKLSSIFFAALVFFVYGGLLWGVFPSSPHISWEGHLFGLLAGGVAARFESRTSPSQD